MYVYLTKQELNPDIKSQNSYMNYHSSNLKRKKNLTLDLGTVVLVIVTCCMI